jgi:hypothetical protein
LREIEKKKNRERSYCLIGRVGQNVFFSLRKFEISLGYKYNPFICTHTQHYTSSIYSRRTN